MAGAWLSHRWSLGWSAPNCSCGSWEVSKLFLSHRFDVNYVFNDQIFAFLVMRVISKWKSPFSKIILRKVNSTITLSLAHWRILSGLMKLPASPWLSRTLYVLSLHSNALGLAEPWSTQPYCQWSSTIEERYPHSCFDPLHRSPFLIW